MLLTLSALVKPEKSLFFREDSHEKAQKARKGQRKNGQKLPKFWKNWKRLLDRGEFDLVEQDLGALEDMAIEKMRLLGQGLLQRLMSSTPSQRPK